MEDTQAAFASQYQTYSSFDIDMMKQRSMDTVGGPDAKKARWSPTSFNGANGLAGNGSASAGPGRDAFANYGYGPQAAAQNGFNGSPPASNFAAAAAANAALYSTPALSLNTAVAGGGMGQQMSPNTAGPYTPQHQQPPSATPNSANPYNVFNGYSMPSVAARGKTAEAAEAADQRHTSPRVRPLENRCLKVPFGKDPGVRFRRDYRPRFRRVFSGRITGEMSGQGLDVGLLAEASSTVQSCT